MQRLAGQVPGEMVDHVARVVLDAVDERGLAPPEHRQAEGVHTRAVDGAAVVAQLTLRVDDRYVEPPVVGPVTRCPDNRPDLTAAEIETEPRRPRHLRRREALGSTDLGLHLL